MTWDIAKEERFLSNPRKVDWKINPDGSFTVTYLVYRDTWKNGFTSNESGHNIVIRGQLLERDETYESSPDTYAIMTPINPNSSYPALHIGLINANRGVTDYPCSLHLLVSSFEQDGTYNFLGVFFAPRTSYA